MDLDARDRKLVCLLDQDARRPLSHLAKQLHISKQAARQRILKMRAAGIISSPYALINMLALGQVRGRLWIRLQMAGPGVEKEMLEFARQQKNTGSAASLTGAYDFLVTYWSRSITDFKASADEFLYRFSGCVKEHDVSFITCGHEFSVRSLAPEVRSAESLAKETGQVELDGTDRKVLAVLAQDAGLSALEIGNITGIGPKTVYYRMRRLEERRVILGYRLGINYRKMGYAQYKFFLTFSNPDAKKLRKVFAYLKEIPELVSITESVGPADLEFDIAVPSANRMQEILVGFRNGFAGLIRDYKYAETMEASAIRYIPD
ncbi:putative HTH-type transcriptional regulator [uncultured archaeon]|nr:putative HTH-type transcriptional regulator [uncultured archaeon]